MAVCEGGASRSTTSFEPVSDGSEVFDHVRSLGKGNFGHIDLCLWGGTTLVAVKRVPKKRFFRRCDHSCLAYAERDSMRLSRSPFLMRLLRTFPTPEELVFILPYYTGGDLAQLIIDHGPRSEKASIFYLSEALLALEALHAESVCHRDIKPNNIMISASGHIVLGDMGLATQIDSNPKSDSRQWGNAGSSGYRAPETVRRQSSGFEADVYSLGITFFVCMLGGLPWAKTEERLKGGPRLHQWMETIEISRDTKKLLQQMLDTDPKHRISLEGIKKHRALKSIDWQAAAERRLEPPWVPEPISPLLTKAAEQSAPTTAEAPLSTPLIHPNTPLVANKTEDGDVNMAKSLIDGSPRAAAFKVTREQIEAAFRDFRYVPNYDARAKTHSWLEQELNYVPPPAPTDYSQHTAAVSHHRPRRAFSWLLDFAFSVGHAFAGNFLGSSRSRRKGLDSYHMSLRQSENSRHVNAFRETTTTCLKLLRELNAKDKQAIQPNPSAT